MKRMTPSDRRIADEVRRLQKLNTGLLASPDPKRTNEIALNDWNRGAVYALLWVRHGSAHYTPPAEHNAAMRRFAERLPRGRRAGRGTGR